MAEETPLREDECECPECGDNQCSFRTDGKTTWYWCQNCGFESSASDCEPEE